MNNKLIEKLSRLTLERKALKRNIDRNYYNKQIRARLFMRLKQVDSEIKKIKFMLKLERSSKSDN